MSTTPDPPTVDEAREAYAGVANEMGGLTYDEGRAEFDAMIALVKRDAAREALDGAEAERDRLQAHYDQARRTIEHGAASEAAAILDYQDRADKAEAQLKAVRQVLDQHRDQTADGLWIDIDDQIPHGDLGNPDQNCGRGVCALGDGHPGPCRC